MASESKTTQEKLTGDKLKQSLNVEGWFQYVYQDVAPALETISKTYFSHKERIKNTGEKAVMFFMAELLYEYGELLKVAKIDNITDATQLAKEYLLRQLLNQTLT